MAEQSRTSVGSDGSSGLEDWKGTARYEVLGCLGRGGMGIVYEALDRQRNERVALKTMLHFDAGSLYRFKQEFRTLADVLHPNLVHLHELVAEEGDEVLFTMELVEGTDFLEYVHKHDALRVGSQTDVITTRTAERRLQRISDHSAARAESDASQRPVAPADFEKLRPALRQLVDGVRALHAAGKLHRDLKPSNVRVTPEGRVVILDFGVATELGTRARAEVTEGGAEQEVVGTATYMAPEQASGDAPVAASDWYSVGALLYEAMVGHPPFTGSALDVLTLKNTVAPVVPSACVQGVPEDLDTLCMALLAPDPEDRPGAAEILHSLGATQSDQAPEPAVVDGPQATQLIGREAHLRSLSEAFEATKDGRAVAVHVAGLSGLGKSAVVHHFLDELERRDDVLVLRGRAYERESMPYKAVDSVVDALCRHLLRLQARDQPLSLPSDIWALAHVFPVLRRVHSIDEIPQATVGDLQVVRQRAFGVLRELFAALSKEHKVVVFIDDVQWGDNDSAALIVELMRPPAEPPLLLLMTHRSEEASTSPFLADLRARWPEEAEVREVTVGPLEIDDARRLARFLLGGDDTAARQTADIIARESGGSPFLLEELARSANTYHRIASGAALSMPNALTLDQMLGDRAARLPPNARRLLEVVAVCGRPVSVSTAGDAAGTPDSAAQLVTLLRARRFVRAGLRNGIEVVEAIHDRVREVLVSHLDPQTAREHHTQLARVLEATPDSDPEAIASHLLGAGDKPRAAHYAERAAEQASAKLAFAQAARLFQLTVENLPPSSPDVRRLYRRVAEASEWAGFGEKAARAYLAAAEGASVLERVDLERAAASQLIAAGHIDEGAAVFRRVLTAVGRAVPSSIVGTIFWVIAYRFASVLLARSRMREAKELAFEKRVRLDALSAAARGLGVVDPISAMYVKARYLVDALRSGDRVHIVHAAATEAATLASGGRRESKRERTLFAIARRIAEESQDKEAYALYRITYGISQYLRGHWRVALESLDAVCGDLAAVRRWNANANVIAVYALASLGDLREVKSRTVRLIADAEQRGDYYTLVQLRASHPIAAWLGSDDVDRARRHLRDAMAQWSRARFHVQHWQAMLWEAEVELYAGDGLGAWTRITRDERPLRRSFLLSVQLLRAFTSFVRGRSAVASLDALPTGERPARLAEARRALRRLEREAMPWTAPLASMLAASLANAVGDVPTAEQALRRSIELGEAAGMALHAASARYQLASLVGEAEGRILAQESEVAMKARGVRFPARYAGMLLPGDWQTAGSSRLQPSLSNGPSNKSAATFAQPKSPQIEQVEDFAILDCEPGAFGFFGWRNVVIAVWVREATGAAVARLAAVSGPIAAAHPEGVSAIHLVNGGAGMPTDEARAGFVEQMTRFSTLACISVVLLGGGFWASALHAAIVGMQSVAPRSFAMGVVGSIEKLTATLPEEHLKRTGVALDPKALGDVLRRALSEVTRERTTARQASRGEGETTRSEDREGS
jgi:serine/threonine protein kinase